MSCTICLSDEDTFDACDSCNEFKSHVECLREYERSCESQRKEKSCPVCKGKLVGGSTVVTLLGKKTRGRSQTTTQSFSEADVFERALAASTECDDLRRALVASLEESRRPASGAFMQDLSEDEAVALALSASLEDEARGPQRSGAGPSMPLSEEEALALAVAESLKQGGQALVDVSEDDQLAWAIAASHSSGRRKKRPRVL